MGKILVIFLCIFSVVVFGSSAENPESISQIEIPTREFLARMSGLENFHEEFKTFKSSLVELSAALGRFRQSLTKNGAAESGQTGQAEEDSSTTPSPRQQSSTPASVENEDRGPIALQLTSCSDALEKLSSPRSKKQTIYPHGNSTSLNVLCDFETDGGGWTIIQKRSSGPKQEFNRTWNDYKTGFGSRAGNFWIGLDNIRALTQNGDQELRIDLEDFYGDKRWAKYSNFSISDASDFYRLAIGGLSGDSTLQDSMATYGNNGQQFSTKDRDNDNWDDVNCAADRSAGGWWFTSTCGASYLNGLYREKGETFFDYQGIIWWAWKGSEESLAKTEMKIRSRKSE